MLENISVLVNGTEEEQLQAIQELTESRLLFLINADEVPAALEYIVTEVTLKRFNRIGSEGLSSHIVEGEHMVWNDQDDFAPYMDDINAYNTEQGNRKVRFL